MKNTYEALARNRGGRLLHALFVLVAPLLTGALLPGPVAGQQGRAQVEEGNRLYSEGRFDDAHQKYLEALLEDPESPLIRFNDGNALYQNQDLQRAVERYLEAAEAGDPALQNAAWYNLGNALFRAQQLQESLEAYKQALRTNPSDMDAKHNLERVLEQIQQQEQQDQGEGEDQEQNQDDGQQNQNQPGQGQQDPQDQESPQTQGEEPPENQQEQGDQSEGGNRAQRANLRKERGSPTPTRRNDPGGSRAAPERHSGGSRGGEPEAGLCHRKTPEERLVRMFGRSPGKHGAAFWLLPGVMAALLTASGGRELAGQEISARAYLTPAAVGVGRTFVVNVEITGSQTVDAEPQLPNVESFATYLGSGTSSSMQVINGQTTVSLTIQYRYQALSEGTFEIPAITVPVGGEEYTTEPLSLSVSSAPPPDPQQPEGTSDPAAVAPEDLFVTAEASRSRVREGEPFIVEYRIFTRVNVTSYGFTRLPELEGFWIEELPLPEQPQAEQVVRDGQQYTSAVIRRVALVPTGPGERTLEPLGIEAQVRVRRQRALDPFENFFDLDRSSLFGTVVPASVVSNAIQMEIDPLPGGRPEPFSGVVGSLTLSTSLSPDSVDSDEALTLTVTAAGAGNFRGIPEPVLDLPGDFEVYPPEVSESVQQSGAGLRGTKSWEYVLIPRAPGDRQIPPISFGYFDTEASTYRTATSQPLDLLVSGELLEGPTGLVRGGVTALREDIRFIHLNPAPLMQANRSVFGGLGFWLVFILPMVATLGATGFRFHQDRLEGDPAFARRRRAGRVAHARLAEAKRLATGEASREFYAEVARALRGFVADKLDMAEAGMQVADVDGGLRRVGVSDEVVQEVLDCLGHCDLQRFAPPKEDVGEETRFLERVSKTMTGLNKEMGR